METTLQLGKLGRKILGTSSVPNDVPNDVPRTCLAPSRAGHTWSMERETTKLTGAVSEYLNKLKDGQGLTTKGWESAMPVPDRRGVSKIFCPEGHDRIELGMVSDRLRDALVDAARDADFRATLEGRSTSSSGWSEEDVKLIGQVVWNLTSVPGDNRLVLPPPRGQKRNPAGKEDTDPDLGVMNREKRVNFKNGRNCLRRVGGGTSLKENAKKLANRMAQYLEQRYGVPGEFDIAEDQPDVILKAAPHASVHDPLPVLCRRGESSSRVLLWDDGFDARRLDGLREIGSERAVSLSARGDVAAAIAGDELHLWWEAESLEVDRAFVDHATSRRGPAELKAVATITGGMLQLVTTHEWSTEIWTRDRRGAWSEPTPAASTPLDAAVLLGDAVIGASRDGRLVSRGRRAETPDVDDILSRVDGVDCVLLAAYDVLAIWGTDLRGTPSGAVLIRRLGGRRGWLASPLEGEHPLRLGLLRETESRTASAVRVAVMAAPDHAARELTIDLRQAA